MRFTGKIPFINVIPHFVMKPGWFHARGWSIKEILGHDKLSETLELAVTVPRIVVQMQRLQGRLQRDKNLNRDSPAKLETN